MSGEDLRANPYVGLRPFFEDDSLYFYGREQQIAELLEILRQHRFLGVVGSSGSGKSSLVRAGLLPSLLGGFLVQDRDSWRTVQIKPGDAPISNLCAGLLKAVGEKATPQGAAALEHDIREGHTDAVVEFLAPRLESNANLFLLVDQFEEIFAFRGIDEEDGQPNLDLARRKERARRKAEAADFVDLLLSVAQQRNLPIYVALTMRTDFLGDCDLFYGLPEALNRGRYLVPRMTREQLRDAVECPALLLGADIAPRLMDRVLNELGDRFDRLPVLQHALLRTWDAWQRPGGVGPIDLPHFDSAGGLEGALNQDAEAALNGLDLGVTARVFKRLTDTDLSQRRVRSPARISELMAAASADRSTIEAVVRRFEEDGRSFVHPSVDGKPDDPRVDISHESLIRQWDRLRGWVDEERQSRDQYKELLARATKKEKRATLLQEPELQMVVDWRAQTTPSNGWAQRYSTTDGDFDSAVGYLDESVDARCRNLAEAELRRRWEKIWNPLILVIFLVAAAAFTGERAGVALEFRQSAQSPSAPVGAEPTPAVPTPNAVVPEGGHPDTKLEKGLAELNSGVDAFVSLFKKFWYLGLFVLAYLASTRICRRLHRSMRFPAILQSIVSSGGHSPFKVRATAEPQDALVVHQTTYASTVRRVAAYLVDWACFFPLAVFFVLFVTSFVFSNESDITSDAETLAGVGLWFVFAWLYTTLQLTSKRQATWGMRAVGIFMTDLHGGRPSFRLATVWYGYRLLTYLGFGFGFFMQPFTAKRQTFHDRAAGTVVLRRPPSGRIAVALPDVRTRLPAG